MDENTALITTAGTVLVALISGAFVIANKLLDNTYRKKYLEEKAKNAELESQKDPIVENMERSSNIKPILTLLLEEIMEADRVTIALFHNGLKYFTGTPMDKLSIEHEVIRQGISPLTPNFQSVPLSLFGPWDRLTMEYKFFYQDVEEIEDVLLKGQIKGTGVQSIISLPLFKDGFFVGALNIQWVNRKAPDFCDIMGQDDDELKRKLIEISERLIPFI